MTSVAFLLDENVPVSVADAARQTEPLMTVRHAGHDPDTPAGGTLDPEVLIFAEANGYALVTFDKTSMPRHLAAHHAAGRHTWGVFIFPNGNYLSAGRIAAELQLVWGASDADEWIDQVVNLPY